MTKTIDISVMNDEQVKALAYDRISIIQQAQAELNVLNQELQRRQQVATVIDEPSKNHKRKARVAIPEKAEV